MSLQPVAELCTRCLLCCSFLALPHLQSFQLDFSELFHHEHINPAAWSAVLAYTLVMVFDIGGAMFGLGNLAGMLENAFHSGLAF